MKGKKRGIVRDQNTRDKIQAGNIINRLQKCINGEIELSPAQVRASEILLNRILPTLTAIDTTITDSRPTIKRIDLSGKPIESKPPIVIEGETVPPTREQGADVNDD